MSSGAIAEVSSRWHAPPDSEDPVRQIRAIDEQMELARQQLSDLADERSRLAAWLYLEHGPTEGARLLGVNRNSLYRIVQRFLSEQGVDVNPNSRRQLREALASLFNGRGGGGGI